MVSDDRGEDITQLDLTKEGTILFSFLAEILLVHSDQTSQIWCSDGVLRDSHPKKAGEFEFSMDNQQGEKVKIEERFSNTPLLCMLRASI